ncbi:neural cell adhesion molecule L1-like protein isoform X2 [Engraulis encrasicolus]|uniref:neural cell adhesion molecule L1-like protein isoform X2 n=1 Tax=Engraulis encrasicolus TaxID=184585 RepID=UPI002FD69828
MMRPMWGPRLGLLLALSSTVLTLNIPLEVEQLPTITATAPSSVIAFPFDESFLLKCEAKGNPQPVFRWTRDGQHLDPRRDARLQTYPNSGSFVIPNNKYTAEYRGKYRCYVSNELGTAITDETTFIIPNVPKFPKEKLPPVEVEEGQPMVLECNPPSGIPPLQIYWMTLGLQHIVQDDRVSMGRNGNLYFSNAKVTDTRRDYCCFAGFPRIRTIVQKTAMAVLVRPANDSMPDDSTEREPSLMLPSADQSEVSLVKGEELELECIAEGLPTPEYTWTKVGEVLPNRTSIKNYGKLLTLSKVMWDDAGMYKCTAKNPLGEKSHLFRVAVEEPPQWDREPPQGQLVTIGSNVEIQCVASGNPRPIISWRMNGQLIGDAPTHNRRVYTDKITLQNVQRSDTAVFQCEAANRHGSIMANINLMVLNARPVILTKDYQEYSAVRGRKVILDCKVFSSPPADIVWSSAAMGTIEEGERFSRLEDGSLLIKSVEREDSGQYSCRASNSEGETAITAKLEIKEATQITEPPQDQKILRGTTAQFMCRPRYDRSLRRELEILWVRNGDEAYLNATEDARYSVTDGMLQIANVSHSDEGLYSCVARTPLDQDRASAYLTVLDVPEAPENVLLTEKRGRSVRLKWTPGNDHNSPITEYAVEYEEDRWSPGRWRQLEKVPGNHAAALLTLQGHLNYRFRVSALNNVGRSPPSKPTDRYKTQATEPDRNPENIKIEGHLPNQMDITWEPLLPVEHNAPGLEYKVSYRRLGMDDSWSEQMVKRHSFVVKNTPTFVPYEIKIQAHNQQGWGPEPRVVTGYSGEDVPLASPESPSVEVMNATLARVRWAPVPAHTLRGHLGGYTVNWWRTQSLLSSSKSYGEKQSIRVVGNRTHTLIPGLKPFSEYRLSVNTFNKRGHGPSSLPVTFTTPEGVPDKMSMLKATNPQGRAVTLVWKPPVEANGIMTGYSLQYQQINDTHHLGELTTVNISSPDVTHWVVEELEPDSAYKFYLRACTQVGCGPAVSEEAATVTESYAEMRAEGVSSRGWFVGLMCALPLATLAVLIACFVSRNRGVKEKDEMPTDEESRNPNEEETFCEYSDNDEKPLKGSLHSLSGSIKIVVGESDSDSGQSADDYDDEEDQFNEDGSFIGEYAGRRRRQSTAEQNGHGPTATVV